MSFGDYLGDIRKEPALNIGNLVYSGKIMGLCSYGNLNNEWLPHFENYYRKKPDGNNYIKFLKELSDDTGIEFNQNNRLTGQTAWDVAKTSQIAFENVFMELAKPHLDEYENLPLILVGGCALNILLNTKLNRELDRDVFVPPNPNDCGIATGMILNHIKPETAIDVTYAGIEILDKHTLMSHVEDGWVPELNIKTLAKDLTDGLIVGVVRETSEHGPRALGNRSILCDPTYPNMKDILNEKVKNREWYRPFAPVCKLEDVSKYFDFEGESRWMSFCPTVKEEYRDKLVSITHVDGTARVQTVTEEQNPWLYNLLTEFEKQSGVGVLLNTSFNVNGKPILSRYSDAFEVYNKTKMDALVLDKFYFKKRR
jgi:carbamoyltransferase